MTEAVSRLRESGMDGIYICLDSVREYPDEIEEVIRTTGVCVTGLHAWIDFGRNPEGYQELVDAEIDVCLASLYLQRAKGVIR